MAASSSRSRAKSGQQRHLIEVYADTQALFKASPTIPSEVLDVSCIASSVIEIPLSPKVPRLEIRNEDTLDMAARYHAERPASRILVLNMASKNKPGGGVSNGRGAQEECLFRRTNAFLSHHPSHYPLAETTIIFSPSITVVKDSAYKRVKAYQVGMVSVPAIQGPPLDSSGRYKVAHHRKLMQLKVNAIFELAIQHGFDTLVLGALGCGVYRNPVDEVFGFFQQAVNNYGAHFERIGFAVLAFGAAGKDNYTKFRGMSYSPPRV